MEAHAKTVTAFFGNNGIMSIFQVFVKLLFELRDTKEVTEVWSHHSYSTRTHIKKQVEDGMH